MTHIGQEIGRSSGQPSRWDAVGLVCVQSQHTNNPAGPAAPVLLSCDRRRAAVDQLEDSVSAHFRVDVD
jgi:hypothetical protein